MDKYGNNILKDYTKLVFPPKTWAGKYFSLHQHNEPRNKHLPTSSINPFNRESSVLIPLYLAVVAVTTGTNSSLDLEDYYGYPKINIETGVINSFENAEDSEYTFAETFLFLSCYAESYLSFKFYLTPFRPTLWLGLITSFVITLIVISLQA